MRREIRPAFLERSEPPSEDFAKKSNFLRFYEQNKPFYAGMIKAYRDSLGVPEMQSWLNRNYDLALSLRELGVTSVPINFLIPIPGTKFADIQQLTPQQCLRMLCLFRFLLPSQEIRIAGGREVHLRSLQPLGLYVANSIFVGDYLTTPGQSANQDWDMISDMGFVLESADGSPLIPNP